jgi:hypothetical protein
MKILVIDVGSTHVKVSATSHKAELEIQPGFLSIIRTNIFFLKKH